MILNRLTRFAAATIVFGVSAVSGGVVAVYAAPITLNAVTVFPVSDPLNDIYKEFISAVNEGAQGKLNIALRGGPEVLRMPAHLEAIQTGTFDMTLIAPAFMYGQIPRWSITEIAAPVVAAKTGTQPHPAFWELVQDGRIRRLLKESGAQVGVEYLGTHVAVSFYFLMKKPVVTGADLRGSRIRFSGGLQETYVFRALGIAPVRLATEEIYEALRRGMIDGVSRHPLAVEFFKEYELAPYLAEPAYLAMSGAIIMNPRRWQTLPADTRKVVSDAALRYEKKAATYYVDLEQRKLGNLREKGSIKVTTLDVATMNTVRQAQVEALDEFLRTKGDQEFNQAIRKVLGLP